MSTQLVKGDKLYYDPSGANTEITGLLVADPSEITWDEEDITPLEDTALAKEFGLTTYDPGNVSVRLLYDPAVAIHVTLRDLGRGNTLSEFQLVFAGSVETQTFNAYVKNWKWAGTKGEFRKAEFQLRKSGAPTFS